MRYIYMNKNTKSLNIFISYSHKNMKYKEKLLISLEALKQSYNIEPWHDGMIDAGSNIDDNIKLAMNKADIILLLVTDSFMASHYCMKKELDDAMKRENQGKCIVVPVMFQETVLSDILSFAKHNRIPEDGKPIATGFKNQNQGCTHAVNMLKGMIDSKFPKCKKSAIRVCEPRITKSKTKKNNVQSLCIQLYKNGKLENIHLTQNMVDLIPKYHKSINDFRTIMDQSLFKAKQRYSRLCKNYKETIIPQEERLNQLRLYLMDICAYTKTHITENVGIKVHFRVSKDNFYLGLIASTDDDDSVDLSSDWTTKMTPIPVYKGLIYHSSILNAPLIKTLNQKLNFKATHNDIWKDYITFTFPQFHSGRSPLISYCISVHRDYYKTKGDMLKILAFLNFGDIIEKYIFDYCHICKGLDKAYNIEDIVKAIK